MQIEQILYASAMTARFDGQALDDILTVSDRNNARLGVTGAMVVDGDRIVQVLEGPPEEVRPLYERIARDARHSEPTVLLHRTAEARQFPYWSMAWIFEPLGTLPADAPVATLEMMAASVQMQGAA